MGSCYGGLNKYQSPEKPRVYTEDINDYHEEIAKFKSKSSKSYVGTNTIIDIEHEN